MKHTKSIFLFRRDLRLQDNRGLIQALNESQEVIPVFNFDPRQVNKHKYFSHHGFQFLIGSLLDLDEQLSAYGSGLTLLEGLPQDTLLNFALESGVQAVFANRDYTPFSIERDNKIRSVLLEKGIGFQLIDDALLQAPESGVKADGRPYTVFTPFFKRNSAFPPAPVGAIPDAGKDLSPQPQTSFSQLLEKVDKSIAPDTLPGRKGAKEILKRIEAYRPYAQRRDLPAIQGTTRLSAHLKFGTCSVREVYQSVGQSLGYDHPLIRQLYWRDFYTHIAFHFPHVFGSAFKRHYDSIPWRKDAADLERWKQGKTGYPIVDAGMRELLATGFMHNRVRMIVASFLTKHLLIDWRAGEQFFAQHLTDYDPAVNNGNWQWSASTGCDAQPYFRIFNPWTQQKKFDPETTYIKRWVAELRDTSPATIHKLHVHDIRGYPAPMVEHKFARQRALDAFGSLKGT